MESETASDYRLERWIAVLLALLFLLPFVANADEILVTDSFHGEEIDYETGEPFLALSCNDGGVCTLAPVTITVTRERDMNDAMEDQPTGKRVEVLTGQDGWLFRSPRLHAGVVEAATPDHAELGLEAKREFKLRGVAYRLRYQCGSAPDAEGFVDCALLLESNGVTQQIATMPAFVDDDGELVDFDVEQFVSFAGDLDHDGKLDLVANVARHWNEWRGTLFLSSAAKDGQLVAQVAELVTTGC